MKKFLIQICSLVIVIIVATVATFSFFKPPAKISSGPLQISQIKIDDATINVELSVTDAQRSKGLSGRASLDPNSGMLFVFDSPGNYQFWMKDMNFPLDFIWINGSKIVDVLPNIPNPSPSTPDSSLPVYSSTSAVDKALEVNAGFAESHNIKIGNSVEYIK